MGWPTEAEKVPFFVCRRLGHKVISFSRETAEEAFEEIVDKFGAGRPARAR